MANRRDYYYRELVSEDELDAGFEGLEEADRAIIADLGLYGLASSLGVVTQHAGTPNLSVDVSGSVPIYDKLGQRVLIPSAQTRDMSVDSSSVSTAVSGAGNEKWVSLFAAFDRALSDPRVDGNSNTVFFVRNETFKFVVTQGAEAGSGLAARPSLDSTNILLADVKLVQGQTQILNANVSYTRTERLFNITGGHYALTSSTIRDAMTQVVAGLNDLYNGAATFAASRINYAGGGSWLDSSTNPAATAEAQFDKMISDLTTTTTGASGADKIGAGAITQTSFTISAGSLQTVLGNLSQAAFSQYGGGGTWADSTTNPATTVEAQHDKVISDLASTSGSGLDKIGCKARTAWLGGRTNVAGTSYAALNKLITDLNDATPSDDGVSRIGAAARGTLSAGSAGTQLTALESNKAGKALNETVTGTWTYSGRQIYNAGITLGGSVEGIRLRAAANIADANATIDISQDVYRCQNAALTTNRTLTLRHTTSPIPNDGDTLTVIRSNQASFTLTVSREDTTIVATLPSAAWSSATFLYTAAGNGGVARWSLMTGFGCTAGSAA